MALKHGLNLDLGLGTLLLNLDLYLDMQLAFDLIFKLMLPLLPLFMLPFFLMMILLYVLELDQLAVPLPPSLLAVMWLLVPLCLVVMNL